MEKTTARINIEELASLPNFYLPSVSPDKSKIAFYWDKSGTLELYVMHTKGKAEARQVSAGQLPRALHAGFVWSKDSQAIYYAKDHDGDEQHNIWRIMVETGEVEQLTDNPGAQEYPLEVSYDNRTLYVGTNLNGQMNIHALDIESRQYSQLTFFDKPAGGLKLSPDGSQIVFSTNETDNFTNSDLYIMNADGSDQRKLFSIKLGSQESSSDWSKDGRLLAVSSDAEGYQRAGIYTLESGEVHWLSPEGKNCAPGKFSPDSSQLLVYDFSDSAISLKLYDTHTKAEQAIELPPGMNYNGDWLSGDRLVLNLVTDVTRPELRDYHTDSGESHVLLGADYGSIDPASFNNLDYVWYDSTDGTPIPALVYRPKHLPAGTTTSAIVYIHGGPTGQFFRGFDPFAQFLCDQGHVIIAPNIRGSTGYGVEFRDACLQDWGGKDLEDVEGAVNYLKTLPEIDPERIGVFGGSYGGYMTFMAVTKKPHLWKAGTAWVGITDLRKLYDSSMEHFKYYLRQQMGDPDQNAELWHDRSAVNFAHQMTARLLIAHGTNDPRCPIEQARIFRDALLAAGRVEGEDFEYVELGEEGHGSTDINQKIRAYTLLADFMRRNL